MSLILPELPARTALISILALTGAVLLPGVALAGGAAVDLEAQIAELGR